jgi:hypothetical protein
MRTLRSVRRLAAVSALAASAGLWYGCSDRAPDSLTGPVLLQGRGFTAQAVRAAVSAQEHHTEALLRIPGVVGTAVGLLPSGHLGVQVFVAHPDVQGVPASVDGVPVARRVTGMFLPRSDPTARERPAPLGYSIGHFAITAGTIGARVRDASGNVYVLSNNHVLANINDAQVGDPVYQPGPYDGGGAADQVATLATFEPIDFAGGNNIMDAALALTSSSDVGSATPLDDAYGAPSATIFGDANGDGFFDDVTALLGLEVQKYGRTTGLTTGHITGVNATLSVCYEVLYIFCLRSATFVDQLVIDESGFSDGGDSGSLLVTTDGSNRPVALLFAGSQTQTIANRIDLVLDHFGVTIDTAGSPPPGPVTDVAVTTVTAPATVEQGQTASVSVTVRNVGNQSVDSAFAVTLLDDTDSTIVDTQTVNGLAVGAQTTLTFAWNTAGSSVGVHTLSAIQSLADDNAANDRRAATVTVNGPLWDVAVISVMANSPLIQGNIAGVNVTLRNLGNQPVGTFTVTLVDETDGVPIGTKSVASLAVGAQTMVTINWNTAGASIGDHTLTGSHDFPDDNPANDHASKSVTVQSPGGPAPVTDVSVTSVSTVASVLQGDTAGVNVTVQNVGNQAAGAFVITLVDATDGVTIGTHSVGGLAAGLSTTVTLGWPTAGRSIGTHTLTASHNLADDNAANNQRSTTVAVTDPAGPAPVTDIAVTSVMANSPLIQGNIAGVNVTVRNLGNQPVGTFTVTLVDETDGVTIGSRSVASLAVGAQTMVTINWNSAGASIGDHTLTGSHDFPDDNPANDHASKTVTVQSPGGPAPVTDVSVTSVSTVASVLQGDTAGVNITVQNVGNQAAGAFVITLVDATDGVTIGTQSVGGLAAGLSTTVTLGWPTAGRSIGTHTLTASHDLADDNAANNQRSTTVTVADPAGPAPVTDVAVTSVNANSPLTQGNIAGVNVTVRNLGNQPVGTFTVTLVDETDGVTIGAKSVASLAVGAQTMVTINWNSAGASIGDHTLTGSHDFPDDNPANDHASKVVTVQSPGGPAPVTDVSVTSVSTVASVLQGDTAGVNITVQNVGNQAAGAFVITLVDATDGVTIGTHSVGGLAAGLSTTVTLGWPTAGRSIGTHTLTASHDLADDNAANNQRSTTVTVADPGGPAPVTDIAVTSVNANSPLMQGSIAGVNVTVRNLGNQPVGTFTVTLVDETDGVTIGAKSIASLAVGATTSVSITWNTAGASVGNHTLTGSHDFPDDNPANDHASKSVTVTGPDDDIHVGDLDGAATNDGKTWTATVTIAIHAKDHAPVAGVQVSGAWSRGGASENQCTTGSDGTCAVTFPGIKKNVGSVSFTVSAATLTGRPYQPAQNHDDDGDSNGRTIVVTKP